MSSDWKKCSLGDFVRLQRGHDLTASEQKPGVIPIMGSAGQNGFHDEAKAKGPGVVIGRSGASAGRVHYSPDDYWPHNTCLYVTDFLGNNPKYVFYHLSTIDLASLNSGSAQPSLNRNYLYSIPVSIPPVSDQENISAFLSSLDDRITLLRETNQTLEAIAQALFKSWFVDFDPVRARSEGRMPEGMDEATAALFPDSFEISELGEIPRGWTVNRVESLLELAYGKALKSTDRVHGSVPVYGSGGITGFHNVSFIDGPSVVVGRKGSIGTLYWVDVPFFPIDTVFYVKTNYPLTYCYYLLSTLNLHEMNTDAAVPGLNRGNVYRLNFCDPPNHVLAAFDSLASTLRNSIAVANEKIELLSSIRDILLPRLISGQLRLPDAEAEIEALTA